jgi:hypothetical protein
MASCQVMIALATLWVAGAEIDKFARWVRNGSAAINKFCQPNGAVLGACQGTPTTISLLDNAAAWWRCRNWWMHQLDEEWATRQTSNNWPNAKWRCNNQGWMTANSNHGGATTDKDGGQMAARQTTNLPDEQKMVVRRSRMNQQMHKTNEDVAMWQPTMVPAKCRGDGTAIK